MNYRAQKLFVYRQRTNTIPIQQPVKHHYLHVNNDGKIGLIDSLIDLIVLNSNFSSITAISWHGENKQNSSMTMQRAPVNLISK